MNKTTEALKLAEALENDAKEHREVSYGLDCPPERTANWKHALNCEAAARLIREVLAEQALQNLSDFHQYMEATEPKCSDHPDAPHGFCRDASHSYDRYVCECEFWEPEENKIYTQAELDAAVLAEREACAKVCDAIERHKWEILTKGGKLEGLSPIDCAAAIRARSNEK